MPCPHVKKRRTSWCKVIAHMEESVRGVCMCGINVVHYVWHNCWLAYDTPLYVDPKINTLALDIMVRIAFSSTSIPMSCWIEEYRQCKAQWMDRNWLFLNEQIFPPVPLQSALPTQALTWGSGACMHWCTLSVPYEIYRINPFENDTRVFTNCSHMHARS